MASIAFIVLGIAGWMSLKPVDAGHGWPATYGYHVANIHWASSNHGVNDEDFCYQTYTSLSNADFKSYLETALWTAGSWDGTGNFKIDLWPTGLNCDEYVPQKS